MNDRMTNKIVDNNIEEIMKEGKTVYNDYGEIIFSQPRYYEYVLDEQRTDEEIMDEYLKWFHAFYGESGNTYNNRFSDKNVIEKFKSLVSNKISKLPVTIRCTFYFVSNGTKDGDYTLYEIGQLPSPLIGKPALALPCDCRAQARYRHKPIAGDSD